MNKTLRKTLTILNCLLLILGNTGGPCLSRLYFNHGGHRNWLLSFLETAGFPILLIPLIISYYYRRSSNPSTRAYFTTPHIFISCAIVGLLTGLDDFLYAYGLSFLPVSTSSLLLASHLVFNAVFAFFIVKQRFTPFSINAVALLTVGSIILGLHRNTDRPANVTNGKYIMGFILTLGTAALYGLVLQPANVTNGKYIMGFILTLGTAALYGLVLPLIELTYMKAKQIVTYTLVMETQVIMGFFATLFCFVGMLINHDFQAIPITQVLGSKAV